MPEPRPTPRGRRGAAAGVGVVVAAYLLAGCGGGDTGETDGGDEAGAAAAEAFAEQSAQSIVDQAQSDTTAADALRVRGDLTVGEQVISIDLRVDQDKQCEGTVGRDGVAAEVLGADGAYWFKPGATYWQMTLGAADAAAVVRAQADRWVATDGIARLCDPAGLFGPVEDAPDVQLATLGTGELAGDQVVRVRRTDADGQSTVSSVSTSSPHYLRQVVGEGDAQGTRIDLGEYGEQLDVQAPSAGDQVPLSDLPLPG